MTAPRPFLLIGGSQSEDRGGDSDDLQSWGYFNRAREVYRLLGIEERLMFASTGDGHHATGPNIDQAPDLIIYFGDLYWRSTGSIGHDSIHSFETEVGPDDAVHAEDGIFLLWDPKVKRGKRLEGLSIYDVAPTVLNMMGIEVPKDMEGKAVSL